MQWQHFHKIAIWISDPLSLRLYYFVALKLNANPLLTIGKNKVQSSFVLKKLAAIPFLLPHDLEKMLHWRLKPRLIAIVQLWQEFIES